MNPSGIDYSFYSSVHNSYSRTDYFLVDGKLILHNIGISNHSPLTFSPGPDGLPSELYKKFSSILSPYLHTQVHTLPPTLSEATVTVIYRKGKDAQDVGSYHLIALLYFSENSSQEIKSFNPPVMLQVKLTRFKILKIIKNSYNYFFCMKRLLLALFGVINI